MLVTDTLNLTSTEISLNNLYSYRTDPLNVVFDELSDVTRFDAAPPFYYVNDTLNVRIIPHDELNVVSSDRTFPAAVTLLEVASVLAQIVVTDNISVETLEAVVITLPLSVVDNLSVACDDVATNRVIISVSDNLNLKVLRVKEVSRGETGSSFYSNVSTGPALTYADA